MHDLSSWSINLGRWGGIHVRLHVLFLVFAVLTLFLASREQGLMIYAGLSLVVLFVSVVLHEAGHCLAAIRVGGNPDQVVLGPLGGLMQISVPHEPQRELVAALAGPMVNFLTALSVIPVLFVVPEADVGGLLENPLEPKDLVQGPIWLVTLKLTFWINVLLMMINLLPAFPLDGGRVLRAVLWPTFGYYAAVVIVARVAKVIAFLLLAIGVWLLIQHEPGPSHTIPAWLPLVLLAIFVFFSARQETERLEAQEVEDELFGYDFSQGYTSLERPATTAPRFGLSGIRRWLAKRKATRERRHREIEQEEERRVDEILVRLHRYGMESLSTEERAVLQRVSARYRNRQQS